VKQVIFFVIIFLVDFVPLKRKTVGCLSLVFDKFIKILNLADRLLPISFDLLG